MSIYLRSYLGTFLDYADRYFVVDVCDSYADKLPKSLMPLRAFASLLETDNIRDFRSAYCSLHNVALSMGNSRAIKTSTYSQQYLHPLLSRLDDPMDKELATLFESHDRLGAASSDSDKFMPELAKGINRYGKYFIQLHHLFNFYIPVKTRTPCDRQSKKLGWYCL